MDEPPPAGWHDPVSEQPLLELDATAEALQTPSCSRAPNFTRFVRSHYSLCHAIISLPATRRPARSLPQTPPSRAFTHSGLPPRHKTSVPGCVSFPKDLTPPCAWVHLVIVSQAVLRSTCPPNSRPEPDRRLQPSPTSCAAVNNPRYIFASTIHWWTATGLSALHVNIDLAWR